MTVHQHILRLLLASVACFVAVPTSAAQVPQQDSDPVLIPVGPVEPLELTSCVVIARLICPDDTCRLEVEQRYRLHNGDRARQTSARIGLPKATGQELAGATLRAVSAGESELARAPDTQNQSPVWQLTLPPDETAEVALTYVRHLRSLHFVEWRWEMGTLMPWGEIEGISIEFALPTHVTDAALLEVSPSHYAFDGTRLFWEYEKPSALPVHKLTVVSPQVVQRLARLRDSGAHRELARELMSLQRAALQEHVPYLRDHFAEAVAELQAILLLDETDVLARLDLAELYFSKANQSTDLRLNYLLLAAQELSIALAGDPSNTQITERLRQIYGEAADIASSDADPEGALVYQDSAAQVLGPDQQEDSSAADTLMLRWAVDRAEQGQVSEALRQLKGVLSQGTEDALLRYAPPFAWSRTDVALEPGRRIVTYTFQLYPSSDRAARSRLSDIATRLSALNGIKVQQGTRESADEAMSLGLGVDYSSLEALQAHAALIVDALSGDDDLLTEVIVTPWANVPETITVAHNPWFDRFLYDEHVNLEPLHAVWATGAEYSGWRLIELRAANLQDERGRLEQRLATLALREQRQTWEQIASGSHWVYRISFGPGTPSEAWVLRWGQARALTLDRAVYLWPTVARTGLALAGVLLLWSLLAVLKVRR